MEKITTSLQSLYEQRDKCIEEEDYYKAEELNNQIKNYKVSVLDNNKKHYYRQSQMNIKSLEDNYKNELMTIKNKWMEKENSTNEELNNKEKELLFKQKEEIKYIQNNWDNNLIYKPSPNYLNLKKIQYNLAKQERYLEAALVKKEADKLIQKEKNALELENKAKLAKHIEKVKVKHEEEKKKFYDDKSKKLFTLRQDKDKELDAFNNKYRTLRVEMSIQQKEEESKATKKLKSCMRRHLSQEKNRNTSAEKNKE